MFARLAAAAVLLPLLGATPVVTPVAAASFDCSKASNAYERALCTVPELGEQDEILATAYATAIGGLGKEAAERMRLNQRAWLAYVQRACTPDGALLEGDYTPDDTNCLHSEIFNHIRDLEQSRMLDGLRFYLHEDFRVLVDTVSDGEFGRKPATKAYGTALIDGDSALATAFNAWSEGILSDLMAGVVGEDTLAIDDPASDVSSRARLKDASSNLITLDVIDWWYGHGAAHGNYTVSYRSFLRDGLRELTAADVFIGNDWVQPLADLTLAALRDKIGAEYIWDDSAEAVKTAVADPTRWAFSEDGITIRFQPYEVTAYAAGAPTVEVPWTALEQFTTPLATSLMY